MIRVQIHEILGRQRNAGHRITMPKLAERCGVDYQMLWRWANGKVNSTNHSLLNALCRELHCQPGDLLIYVPDDESA